MSGNKHAKRYLLPTVALLCASLVLLLVPARSSGAARTFVAAGARADESAATREGRLRVFDDVWETVRARYYDPALHGVVRRRHAQSLVDLLGLGAAGDGLAIGDLRLADADRDAHRAAQAVDQDLEVELAHPGDHRLE